MSEQCTPRGLGSYIPEETVNRSFSAPSLEGQQTAHNWRVDALFYGLPVITAYDGPDLHEACRRVGEMCLSLKIDKVFVYRDGAKYRHVEVLIDE